jgi:hypothetical protein
VLDVRLDGPVDPAPGAVYGAEVAVPGGRGRVGGPRPRGHRR